MNDQYNTIEKISTGYFKDKGSKFYSFLYPVKNEDEVKTILTTIKKEHHSARHHCYAWRIGAETVLSRANDDGEPSSTAGKPILGQLVSFDVTNALLVVVRYFGGTLLGVSGLINAYRNAAADALNRAEILHKFIELEFELLFNYDKLNDVMHIIKQNNYNIVSTRFEESCSLICSVRQSESEKLFNRFNDFYGIEIKKLT